MCCRGLSLSQTQTQTQTRARARARTNSLPIFLLKGAKNLDPHRDKNSTSSCATTFRICPTCPRATSRRKRNSVRSRPLSMQTKFHLVADSPPMPIMRCTAVDLPRDSAITNSSESPPGVSVTCGAPHLIGTGHGGGGGRGHQICGRLRVGLERKQSAVVVVSVPVHLPKGARPGMIGCALGRELGISPLLLKSAKIA
jgi:hypothetical protein